MDTKEAKIRVERLVMIFGKAPKKQALPLLQQNVSKEEILQQTGHVIGVSDVSFSVQEGEIFVVMGLSGSGKSTLIRCINRLIEPTSGHVYIDDEDILQVDRQRLRELRRTKLAMVFQHFALLPHQTVAENVAYGLKIRGVSDEERRDIALEALDLVGLKQWADRLPDNLSGGMKQRVGLARALAMDADILLMDEAFSALDPLIRRQMQNELLELQKRLKKTVLFITHDLNEALRVGNHVAIMKDGDIVQIGNPVEIITQPANDYVAAFMQDVDQSRVLTAEVVMQSVDNLVVGRDALHTLVNRMKAQDDASAFYVVDGQRKAEGLIRKQRLLKATKDGKQDWDSGSQEWDKCIEKDFPTISTQTSLTDLYALVANDMPVAVTDGAGRLVGVIRASDVISGLAMVEQVAESVEMSAATGVVTGSDHSNGNGTSSPMEAHSSRS